MHKPDARFYIYAYFRMDGSPCYIGKGSGVRWRDHLRKKGDDCHNPRLRALIKRSNSQLPIVIICEHLTEAEAMEYEKTFIAAIGRGKNGPLVNFTDGGDGTSGNVFSDETKAKIGAANRGRKKDDAFKQRRREYMSTFRHTEETKAKIAAAHLGKKMPDGFGAEMSRRRKGIKLPPERAVQVALNFKRPKSDDHKEKLRQMCIARNIANKYRVWFRTERNAAHGKGL